MRVIFKIFSILFALYILSILFVSPAKAACSEDAYGNCTGTCNCASYGLCGSCSCQWQSDNYCGATGCSPCPTNPPQPTSGGGPGVASPTDAPGGMQCSSTTQCYHAYCAPNNIPTPACSSVCINGHCHTTHGSVSFLQEI